MTDDGWLASSSQSGHDGSHSPFTASGTWKPTSDATDQWLQAEFWVMKVIIKVSTQGRQGHDEFVTAYKISTSNGGELEYILNSDNSQRIFAANTNDSDIVENCFDSVQAFAVRFHPISWHNSISLRWELSSYSEGET